MCLFCSLIKAILKTNQSLCRTRWESTCMATLAASECHDDQGNSSPHSMEVSQRRLREGRGILNMEVLLPKSSQRLSQGQWGIASKVFPLGLNHKLRRELKNALTHLLDKETSHRRWGCSGPFSGARIHHVMRCFSAKKCREKHQKLVTNMTSWSLQNKHFWHEVMWSFLAKTWARSDRGFFTLGDGCWLPTFPAPEIPWFEAFRHAGKLVPKFSRSRLVGH